MTFETATPQSELTPVDPAFLAELGVNQPEDAIIANMVSALRRGLPQLRPYATQQTPLVLVCGGPSLIDTLSQIREQYWDGAKIVAMNGSYEWCLERGMRPAMMFMVDARDFNARFLTRPAPRCTYWLSSQCHPATFDRACAWPSSDVRVWHTLSNDREKDLLDRWYTPGCYMTGGFGTTVGLRALTICVTLGFHWFDIYGMDSCIAGTQHHAYEQPENDGEHEGALTVQLPDGWQCLATSWQACQADEAMKVLDQLPPHVQVRFHGDGLIAHRAMLRDRALHADRSA